MKVSKIINGLLGRSTRPDSPVDDVRAEQIARNVYQDNRYYHGTSENAKMSIKGEGFKIGLKGTGATQSYIDQKTMKPGSSARVPKSKALQHLEDNATKNHYVTNDKAVAVEMASRTLGDPALVRVLGRKSDMKLKADPDSVKPGSDVRDATSFATPKDIRRRHVLGTSGKASVENADTFRKLLRSDQGLNVSRDQAMHLLTRVQSSSTEDFASSAINNEPAFETNIEGGLYQHEIPSDVSLPEFAQPNEPEHHDYWTAASAAGSDKRTVGTSSGMKLR